MYLCAIFIVKVNHIEKIINIMNERISDAEIKKMQGVILNILKAIHKVCEEHNLKYYLIAGTMLGAVRHKGFIPWDDDADIALPREDYNLLVANAKEWLPEQYELVSYSKDTNYPYAFARIQDKNTTYILRRCFDFVGGVPVDVFPLDGMTQSKWKRFLHYRKYSFAVKMMYFSTVDPYKHGKGLESLFVRLCRNIVPKMWAFRLADKIQQEYSIASEALIADHDNKPYRGILDKNVYGTPTPISFEGEILYGVEHPDAYLSYCYGDYMKMPKEKPLQNFRYMDLSKPYREYMKENAPC